MKQGVLFTGRVRLLMSPGDSCFRGNTRRMGERRRKSVRGCIVSPDIAVLNLVILKQGETPIPGLTDREIPRIRGPKRASKIRKLFKLTKEEDVVAYSKTLGREIPTKSGVGNKKKLVKVQRLVTPLSLQRKRVRTTCKKANKERSKTEAAEYHQLLVLHYKENKEKKKKNLSVKKASLSISCSFKTI